MIALVARANAAPEPAGDGPGEDQIEPGADAELADPIDDHEHSPDILGPRRTLPTATDATALVAVTRSAPALAAVRTAALRAAGLERDPVPSWRVRARMAALAPWLGVRVGQDTTWHDVADSTVGYVSIAMVTASWHLDRLVFEPNELRIAALDVSRRRERRRLAALVARVYFDWVRATASARTDACWQVVADEAAGHLDALTDGWFFNYMAPNGDSALRPNPGQSSALPDRTPRRNLPNGQTEAKLFGK